MRMYTKVFNCGNQHLLHLHENTTISENTLRAHFSQPMWQFDTLLRCQRLMKVGIEEWSENSKDRGHLAKNKAVGKLIKIKAIYHEICKTVTKNFSDL